MGFGGFDNAAGSANLGRAGKEMEQEVAVELKASEETMKDHGEFRSVGSDGAVWIEGDGEGEDLAPVNSKKKLDDLFKKVSLSAAFVLLLAMTGWMVYRKVLAPPPKPPLPGAPGVPGLPGIDGQIALYSIGLFEVRDALDVAWIAAPESVKKAFVGNYMPSAANEAVALSQALSFYKLQVLQLGEIDAPSRGEEIYVKKQHLHKQLLLYCILDAAAQRLEGLRHMEEDTSLPALILDREQSIAKDQEGSVAVGLFLDKLKERGISYTPRAALGKEQAVRWAKVNELLNLLEMEQKLAALDKKVQEKFEVFLEGHGFSLKTLQPADIEKIEEIALPRDKTAVDAKTLVGFLHARYNDRGFEDYRNELLDDVVMRWSERKVGEAIEAFKEHYRGFLRDQIRQKRELLERAREEPRTIPLTHGFPLAIFLM